MENEELLLAVMGIIVNAGNAKSLGVEAIRSAKKGEFEMSEAKIKEAREALINAHQQQTALLTKEASGANFEISLLMIHSQDHLMTTITYLDLAEEIIDLHKTK